MRRRQPRHDGPRPIEDWLASGRIGTIVLLAATVAGAYLCALLAAPFLPALTWAVVLSVLFVPIHRILEARLKQPNLAALLALVPVLGAFVVWIPATIYLALDGDWTKAAILGFWGAGVVGTIDNLLYPILVGKRLELHSVPAFISFIGGLQLFGASGLVLGPMVVTLTLTLLDIWRRRTTDARD